MQRDIDRARAQKRAEGTGKSKDKDGLTPEQVRSTGLQEVEVEVEARALYLWEAAEATGRSGFSCCLQRRERDAKALAEKIAKKQTTD